MENVFTEEQGKECVGCLYIMMIVRMSWMEDDVLS